MPDEIELSEAERAEDAAGHARWLEELAEDFVDSLAPLSRVDVEKVLARARAIWEAETSGEPEPAQEPS